MNKPVSMKDVAAEVGVSAMTVSAILRGKGSYAEETIRKVHEVANRLGYRRNSQARAMRRGRSDCLALIHGRSDHQSKLEEGIVAGIDAALADTEFHLATGMCRESTISEMSELPKILRESAADGAFVNYHYSPPPAVEELLKNHRIPAVWLNNKRDVDSVYFDDLGAARLATEHLLDLGHRRLAYVEWSATHKLISRHYSRGDRQQGYVRAMEAAGLMPQVICDDGKTPFATALKAELEAGVTAFITMTDCQQLVGHAALMGYRAPDDFSILALAHRPLGSYVPLATVQLSWSSLGREAGKLMLRKLAADGAAVESVAVAGALHEGGSCARLQPG